MQVQNNCLRLVFLGDILGMLVAGLSLDASGRGSAGSGGGAFLALIELVRQWHLIAEDARLGKPLQQVPLFRYHVRQCVHLVLERRYLLGRRYELAIVLVHVLLQLRVGVFRQRLQDARMRLSQTSYTVGPSGILLKLLNMI